MALPREIWIPGGLAALVVITAPILFLRTGDAMILEFALRALVVLAIVAAVLHVWRSGVLHPSGERKP